jgi:chromosome segregation ATPase
MRLRTDLEAAVARAEGLEKQNTTLQLRIKSLEDGMSDLRVTLAENEEQLAQQHLAEDIMETLANNYKYCTPEEVIGAMETMKRTQASLDAQLQAYEEKHQYLEKALEKITKSAKEQTESYIAQLQEAEAVRQRAESQAKALMQDNAELMAKSKELGDIEAEYSWLRARIHNWYNSWVPRAELWDNSGITGVEDNDVKGMVVVLQELADRIEPSRVVGQQQENFELASQIWRELFSDQDDIRLLPNKIFRQLRDHCTIKLKESAGVQRRMQEYRDQVLYLQEENDALMQRIEHLQPLKQDESAVDPEPIEARPELETGQKCHPAGIVKMLQRQRIKSLTSHNPHNSMIVQYLMHNHECKSGDSQAAERSDVGLLEASEDSAPHVSSLDS